VRRWFAPRDLLTGTKILDALDEPIRLDDVALVAEEARARVLRGQGYIGDSTRCKDHDTYRKTLEQMVLRDLEVDAS
jgi:hypothetical protein